MQEYGFSLTRILPYKDRIYARVIAYFMQFWRKMGWLDAKDDH